MRIRDWSSDVCSSDLRTAESTQCHVKQPEDDQKAQRHHDRQPFRCRGKVLELTAPFEVIARRQLNLCDLCLRFLNERTGIASAEIDQLGRSSGREIGWQYV